MQASQSRPRADSQARCPARKGLVALILRGQAFRGAASFASSGPSGLRGCSPYADLEEQIEATQSLISNLIRPLESSPCGNSVKVFLSECSLRSGCPLVKRLHDLLGKKVVASQTQCESANQPRNMRIALELFKMHAEDGVSRRFRASLPSTSASVITAYDLIIITRHDVLWRSPITLWSHANFSTMSFLGGCEPRCAGCERISCSHCPDSTSPGSRFGGPPSRCVQDMLHMMPGRSFATFDTAVGSKGCFDGSNKGSGHKCLRAVESFLGESTTALVLPLDVWRPVRDVREPSPVSQFVVPMGAHGRTANRSATLPASKLQGAPQLPCHIAPADRLRMPIAMQRRMCGQVMQGGLLEPSRSP